MPKLSKRFRRDYARIRRSGKNIAKLDEAMMMLTQGIALPAKYKDHSLRGELQHMRDCHIEGDWILLYELGRTDDGQETILFHATDNHENLFG